MKVKHTYTAVGINNPNDPTKATLVDSTRWNDNDATGFAAHTLVYNITVSNIDDNPPPSAPIGTYTKDDIYITRADTTSPISYIAYRIVNDGEFQDIYWQKITGPGNPAASGNKVKVSTTVFNPPAPTPSDYVGDLYVYAPDLTVNLTTNVNNTTWICVANEQSIKSYIPLNPSSCIISSGNPPSTASNNTYRVGLMYFNTINNSLSVLKSVVPRTVAPLGYDDLTWGITGGNATNPNYLPIPLKFGFYIPFVINTATASSREASTFSYSLKYLPDVNGIPVTNLVFSVTYEANSTPIEIRNKFIEGFNTAINNITPSATTPTPVANQLLTTREDSVISNTSFKIAFVSAEPISQPNTDNSTYIRLIEFTAPATSSNPVKSIVFDINGGLIVGSPNASSNLIRLGFRNSNGETTHSGSSDINLRASSGITFARNNLPVNNVNIGISANTQLGRELIPSTFTSTGSFRVNSVANRKDFDRDAIRTQSWSIGTATQNPPPSITIPFISGDASPPYFINFTNELDNAKPLSWITKGTATSQTTPPYQFSRFTYSSSATGQIAVLVNVLINWADGYGSFREVGLHKNIAPSTTLDASLILGYMKTAPVVLYANANEYNDLTSQSLNAVFLLSPGDNFSVWVAHDNQADSLLHPPAPTNIGNAEGPYVTSSYLKHGNCTRITIHELI